MHFDGAETTRASLLASFEGRRLVVCVGPGGVGKTTMAAALGLMAAEASRRVLVLTVDPAKRLADALGLDGIDDTERSVPVEGSGSLHVAMLDTKQSYDQLIGRIADADAAKRIRENAVYAAFSKTLAKSHAYIAAERLYEAMNDPRFDLVILDTPPTRSALEILDAPRTLARFVDADILKYFLRQEGASPFLAIARAGGRAALSLLSSIAGESIASELLSFIEVLASQREGFAERAKENERTLAAPETLYCLVAAPEHAALADARFLAGELRTRHRSPELVLVNQAFALEFAQHAPMAQSVDEVAQASSVDLAFIQGLADFRDAHARTTKARLQLAQEFASGLGEGARLALPTLSADIQSLQGLRAALSASRALSKDA